MELIPGGCAMPAVTGISRRRSNEPVLGGGLTPSWVRTRGKRLKPRYAMHLTAAPAAAGLLVRHSAADKPFPSAIRFAGHNGQNSRSGEKDSCRHGANVGGRQTARLRA